MRRTTISLLVTAVFLSAACATRGTGGNGGDNTGGGNTGGGDNTGVGDNSGTDGGNSTGGGGTTDFTVTTISNAFANHSSLHSVEIDNATVIASNSYAGSSGGTIGTFYIQDGSGPGLAVYHGSGDSAVTYPNVGDVVNVQGHLSVFNGSLQISTSTKYATSLSITVVGAGQGTVPDPVTGLSTADYAPTASDLHDDQVGHMLQFGDALTITNQDAIDSTKTDGTKKPAGFEVTGGLLVDDSFVYHDCIATLPNKLNDLDLSHGIRGVWDRYQDFNAGSSTSPAPTVPVLVPMSCADLNPAQ